MRGSYNYIISTISVPIRRTKYQENEERVFLKPVEWTRSERNDTFVGVRAVVGKLVFRGVGIGVL